MDSQLKPEDINLTFADYFNVSKEALEKEGLFNVSLVADLPVFIDPFLLFHSKKPRYQKLHKEIIKYLLNLKSKSEELHYRVSPAYLKYYFSFPEIPQNWFGFTFIGNKGHGLGLKFAGLLSRNFDTLFDNFGKEKVTQSSHFEKLCLITKGVGRDTISDFSTNLTKGFLLEETERFAKKYIHKKYLAKMSVGRIVFNYRTQVWESRVFTLPIFRGDFVILTPKDLLTRDEAWINKGGYFAEFELLPPAIPNEVLRGQLISYFNKKIREYTSVKKDKNGKEKSVLTTENRHKAIVETTEKFPVVIEYYIRRKEEKGTEAANISKEKVHEVENILETQYRNFLTDFANLRLPALSNTHTETLKRAQHMKHWIEFQDGYKNLYSGDTPMDEDWIQRLFWLCWYGSISDVNREVANGRGKVDYTISQGKKDKTLAEFKLAKSPSLKDNLQEQLELYKKVNQTEKGVWIIIFFTAEEGARARAILKEVGMENAENVVLIDARKDNKQPASKLKAKKLT